MIEQIINWFNTLSPNGWFYIFCWIIFICSSISYLIVFGWEYLRLKRERKIIIQKYKEGLIKND